MKATAWRRWPSSSQMLMLLCLDTNQVEFHFPGEGSFELPLLGRGFHFPLLPLTLPKPNTTQEGWSPALGRVRWSASVALRGWSGDEHATNTTTVSSTEAPATMTLLVAADALPPSMPFVSTQPFISPPSVLFIDCALPSLLM